MDGRLFRFSFLFLSFSFSTRVSSAGGPTVVGGDFKSIRSNVNININRDLRTCVLVIFVERTERRVACSEIIFRQIDLGSHASVHSLKETSTPRACVIIKSLINVSTAR